MAPKERWVDGGLRMIRRKSVLRIHWNMNPDRFLCINGSTQNDKEKEAITKKFVLEFLQACPGKLVTAKHVAKFLAQKMAEGAITDGMSNLST